MPDIIVQNFSHATPDSTIWKYNDFWICEIKDGFSFPLTAEEIALINDGAMEATAIKPQRYHKIHLTMDDGNPSDFIYRGYVVEKVELVPELCLNCGKEMPEEEVDKVMEVGVDLFCSQYCFEVLNGTPMPISQGALVFDKWINSNR